MRYRRRLFALLLPAFLLAGCTTEGAGRTEILWDTWGVPHIFARDAGELAYAFGYAQAHSHGDLLLRLYGQARGRAAEYWGERYLEDDRLVRTMGVPARAADWYDAQEPGARRYLDAFAAGVNAYAAAHPDRLDDAAEAVLPVTAVDVLAHLQRVVHLTFVGGDAVGGARRWEGARGSNAWAIGPARSADGHAMLVANPHLPWGDRFTWYEAQLAAPGLDAYGAALVGMPVLAIAFNDHLGWTHTNNVFDGADLYELRLAGDGYAWNGGTRAFETTPDTLRVRQADGTVRAEPFVVRRSVHGPVVAEGDGRALAVRVAGLDQPHLVGQYLDMMRATDLASFEAALARLQNPFFNVVYADRAGHVLYVFGGRTPRRPHGDWSYWQGVVPGDTSGTLWTETLPYEALPRVVDPPGGFVQNANDPPWTSTFPQVLDPADFPPYLTDQGMGFRPQQSVRLVLEDTSITFDELAAYKHSTRLEMADRVLDDLLPAARQHGAGLAREAAGVLEAWDRTADAGSRGAVLFAAWVRAMRDRPLFATPWDAARPRTTPDGLADPAAAVAALEEAAAGVRDRHGRLDMAWGDVYRLQAPGRDLPANGAADPLGAFRLTRYDEAGDGRYRATGGDSYVALVSFAEPVRARVLLGYGNASQPGSPHRGDQLDLYARKALRLAWRTRAEVEANLEAREMLRPDIRP